jgi:predicted amidohydrolase YtcJ
VHVIGDAAFEQALNAMLSVGRGLNHALVHAQITNYEQIARTGAAGLSVLAQPVFLRTDIPIVRARVGARADSSYRWKSFQKAGALVAFGTDSPVEPFDPLLNIYCAIQRKGPLMDDSQIYLPDEAFTLDEAIYAYTAAGAEVSGDQDIKGKIVHGMLADFVIIGGGEQPIGAKICGTYVGGDCVWSGE